MYIDYPILDEGSGSGVFACVNDLATITPLTESEVHRIRELGVAKVQTGI